VKKDIKRMSSNIPTIRFAGGDATSPAFLYMNGMENYTEPHREMPTIDSASSHWTGPSTGPQWAAPSSGPAVFDDADAGSGSFEPSIQSGVNNVLQHHMNVATSILPDARDILRPWNRRLQNTIQHQSAANLAFLKSDELTTFPTIEQHNTFLKSIDTPGFLTSKSWLLSNVKEVVNQEDVLADLSGVLGISIPTLHHVLRESVPVYQTVIQDMFAMHNRLQKKLEQTDLLTKKLLSVSMDDSSDLPESEALRTAILNYASSQYEAFGIKRDYIELCTLYSKYQALRSVLLLRQITESSPPTCTICMNESVNMTLIPCGHTFCSPCGSKQRSTCYICRVGIRDRQRLYFL